MQLTGRFPPDVRINRVPLQFNNYCRSPFAIVSFQVMEEAFILTLTDILDEGCDEKVAKAWRELFGFMAATMLKGLKLNESTKHCEDNLPLVG